MHGKNSLATILLGLAFMSCGNALVNIIIPLKALELTFTTLHIGWMVSFYYAGFLLGCVYTPRLVKRAGHIRAFILIATILSTVTLTYSLIQSAYLWIGFRSFSGFCIAAIYMIAESWVNDVAEDGNRSRTISYYRIVDLTAVVFGQLMVGVIAVESNSALVYANIIMSFGVIPLAMTTSREPAPIQQVKVSIKKVARNARSAAMACLIGGMAWGAFLGLGPVFARKLEFADSMIGFFISFAIVSGIGFQAIIGMLADKYDNEKMLTILSLCSVLAALAIWQVDKNSLYLILLVGVWGGFATPIYSLSIAIGNRLRADSSFIEVSGSLLFIYSIGAIIGPKLAVSIMEFVGVGGLFLFIAGAFSINVIVIPYFRLRERRTKPLLAGQSYVPAPRTSPTIYEIDPRTQENSNNSLK